MCSLVVYLAHVKAERCGKSLVFIWSFSKRPNTKNHANAIPTYWMGIGAKPGIPITEITEEMTMSARIAAKSGYWASNSKSCLFHAPRIS